jgi:hypothetical protein
MVPLGWKHPENDAEQTLSPGANQASTQLLLGSASRLARIGQRF